MKKSILTAVIISALLSSCKKDEIQQPLKPRYIGAKIIVNLVPAGKEILVAKINK